MNRYKAAASSRTGASRLNPVHRRVGFTPYNRENRPHKISPATDSGNGAGDRQKTDRRLMPMLNDAQTTVVQLSGGIERDFLMFVEAAQAKISQDRELILSLKKELEVIPELRRTVETLTRQRVEARRAYDEERQAHLRSEKELEQAKKMLRKVGAYCTKTGADPRSISESSSDDVPRQDVDNFLGRICHMDTIQESDKNSTSDSILLSGAEETGSEDFSRYNLRQQRSRSGRQERAGRRSRSVNMEKSSRSRSRARRARRSSAEPANKENVFVASTTVHFNAVTGEPTRATASLAQEKAKRRAEQDGETAKRVKTIEMTLSGGDDRAPHPTAPPLGSQNTSGGILASLAQTPCMARTNAMQLETPPTQYRQPLQPMKHKFFQKNPNWMSKIPCQACGKTLKTKSTFKCTTCCSMCHDVCRDNMPIPCVALPPPDKYPAQDLRAYVSEKIPMLPVLLINCVREIESRGLDTLGLYRVNGSVGKVEELYEKFLKGLKGEGFPPLCDVDVTVLCSLIKLFFKKLNDTLIPAKDFEKFTNVCSQVSPGEFPPELKDLVRSLPRPNRDTLTFLLLHLKRVASEDAVKMPIANLAKVFGPSITGAGNNQMSLKSCFSVVEALLNAPNEFYAEVLDDGLDGATCSRVASSASVHGGLGPFGGHGTMARVRQLQASATKSRIFASPYLAD